MEISLEGINYWHLYTDGSKQPNIFNTDEEFKTGMTAIAMAFEDALEKGLNVKIYSFTLMNNHLHELVSGSYDDCKELFSLQKKRLSRFVSDRVSLSNFVCELLPLEDISSLQNEICYIHRNAYVANLKETPYSYKWSTAPYYFNEMMRHLSGTMFGMLPFREKRKITRSAVSYKYDNLIWTDGYISPLSYCEIYEGQNFFKNAHQYFIKLSRNYESYSHIAQKLSDQFFLTDEDLYVVLCAKSRMLFNLKSPKLLNQQQRIEIAKVLSKEYKASQNQLKRLLKIPEIILQEFFPKAR